MPGVLTDGGPRGLDDERAWRLRDEGASLCGSSCTLSERIAASATDDIVIARWWTVCYVEFDGERERCRQNAEDATRREKLGKVGLGQVLAAPRYFPSDSARVSQGLCAARL